jgi:hypothetical protein
LFLAILAFKLSAAGNIILSFCPAEPHDSLLADIAGKIFIDGAQKGLRRLKHRKCFEDQNTSNL